MRLVLVVVSLPVIVGMCYIIGVRCGQAFGEDLGSIGKSKIDVFKSKLNASDFIKVL